jgi:hypothetical protein
VPARKQCTPPSSSAADDEEEEDEDDAAETATRQRAGAFREKDAMDAAAAAGKAVAAEVGGDRAVQSW